MLLHLGVAIQFFSFEVSVYFCCQTEEKILNRDYLLLYLIIWNLSLSFSSLRNKLKP